MKKILYISLLLLASACSSNILGTDIPYAEDIQPISVIKTDTVVVAKIITPKVTEKEYVEEIQDLSKIAEVPEYKEVKKKYSSNRPEIKAVKAGEFPNIKDIPEAPNNFPSAEKINSEKIALLSQTIPTDNQNDDSLFIAFTGLDDELLIFTTEDILQRKLPEEYKSKRAMLSASIGEELSMKDLEAIELVVKDRMRNLKPTLISFYGDDTIQFKQDTIGTLLLTGLDPSLIYIEDKNSESSAKAEISLYY